MSINRIRLDWVRDEDGEYRARKGDINASVNLDQWLGHKWEWSVNMDGQDGFAWLSDYSRSDSARRGAERFLARLQKSLNRGIHRDNL